ncbi:DUF3192 domain-containing protein [Lacimicrobium alkaliphilum]|uniref:DUF3192 domain-containing protein n=1 Tax=Lacimicrobium alkaliphilum TaxID=1526571 RepID=A0ABQ1RGI2_9ALTE|nr:DUF3192 domain-containing protein [Lacimicrobium alkaliphilum]GGD66995.1 DUF3192 domain-containing protein [Lacimicrobium alkaliphilum]
MNNKFIKRAAIGFGIYLIFAALVLVFYPDDPDSMDWRDREQYNKVQMGKLELGTSRQQIIELMGAPDISEAKQIQDQQIQIMFYRTQHMESDGITTMNECTPLLFENDVLIAWGDGTYQQYTERQ